MQLIHLPAFQELRFESSELRLFITEGIIEYLGQELLNERWYIIKNTKGFLYSLTGGTVKLDGKIELFYISKHTNLKQIINYYYNNYKIKNNKNILVLGKGRSTFTNTIVNLLLRNKKQSLITELAPETGFTAFPGVLGISLVDKLIEFNKGIDLVNSLLYFYGCINLEDHFIQYKQIVNKILTKLKNDKNIKEKTKETFFNFIIGPNNLEIINLIKEELKIDEMIILGDERLFHLLEGNKVYIPNSGYIKNNKLKIREYFYGKNDELTPFNLYTKNFNCFSWNKEVSAPTSALPLGAERKLVVDTIEDAEVENNFVYGVMEEKGINPCIGFVVPLEGNRILAPKNKLMKDVVFFKGNIKYYEG